MYKIYYLSIAFLIVSCYSNNKKESLSNDFNLYKSNFKSSKLPLIIKGCEIFNQKHIEFKENKFTQFKGDASFAYKKIPSNGEFITLISFAGADCYIPIITTYQNDGKIIDSQSINIGNCGSDCGYNCKEFMKINKDYSIYVSDTISSFDCDSIGNPIPGTLENYIIYKKGKINKNGKIDLSDETKIHLPIK